METPGKSGKKSKKEKSSKKKSGKKEKKRALEDDEAVVTTPVASVKDEGSTSKKGKGERTVHAPRFFPLSAIASPLASDEEAKKLFVLVGKAIKANKVRRGVKEGTKFLRKGEKGIMIFAGDVEPLDVMSHMPVLCEDNDVPYIFVKSREELGMNAGLKRPTTCILVKSDSSYEAEFNQLKSKIPPAQPTY